MAEPLFKAKYTVRPSIRLRSQEAVQSSLSLKTWLKAIERGEN
ncbi:integrase domain-containing protein, partial [Escherichia coli]